MNIICTIANASYMEYAARLIYSIRNAGWKGRLVVITEEADFYIASAEMAVVDMSFINGTHHNDNRWLQFDVERPFDDGDKIMYIDADCVVEKHFPFEELFKETFACPKAYDKYNEMKIINKFLNRTDLVDKFIGTPFIFQITPEVRLFFRVCRALCWLSNSFDKGTMPAFNMACHLIKKPKMLPLELGLYWEDVERHADLTDESELISYKRAVDKQDHILIHYGGSQFKKVWKEDYLTSAIHEERLKK